MDIWKTETTRVQMKHNVNFMKTLCKKKEKKEDKYKWALGEHLTNVFQEVFPTEVKVIVTGN